MKTVHITTDFTGYPNDKDKRAFIIGEEPELSNEYAKLIVDKGLAREIATTTETGKATPAAKAKD